MTDDFDKGAQAGCRGGFAGNWVSGGDDSRSFRRRLMAILRKAHQVLGVSRKALGLGTLGAGSSLAVPLLALGGIGWVSPAQAQAVNCAGSPYNFYNGTASCMGYQATASGMGATALGSLASADVLGALAVGYNSNAAGQNGISLGFQAYTAGTNAIYLGARSAAGTGSLSAGAIGIGTDVTASNLNTVAVGTQSVASGGQAIALGFSSRASGLEATALGYMSIASGVNATALGNQITAAADGSIAIGANTGVAVDAASTNAIAIGWAARAVNAPSSVALGQAATASAANTVALGLNASVTGEASLAVGYNTSAGAINSVVIGNSSATGPTGNAAVAIGLSARATGSLGSTAIGRSALASQDGASAYGFSASATGVNSSAFGQVATASGPQSVALGNLAAATNAAATAVGNGAQAQGNSSLALGAQAIAVGSSTVAVGQGAGAGSTVGNSSSVAMGVAAGALVSGAQNTAIGGGIPSVMRGAGSGVTGTRNLALGTGDGTVTYDGTLQASAGSLVTGNDNIALGTNAGIGVAVDRTTSIGFSANANSADAVAIGTRATAGGGKAVAIGADNVAYGDGAVAIGDPSYASGRGAFTGGADNIANADGTASATAGNQANGAVAIGNNNVAIGQGSVALGNFSRAGAAGAVAFGDGAIATNAGDVALGSGSQTAAAVPTPNVLINGTTYGFAGTAPTSTVSVGAAGAERTITNVAAGRISGSSTDAINGSQLFATNQAVDGLASTVNNIEAGGGIKYFRANSALPDSQPVGTDSVAVGPAAQSFGANSVAIGTNAVANNVGDVAIGSNSVSGPTTVVAGTTIGGTAYSFAGGTPAGAFSIGSAGQERQIQHVAAGQLSSSSTDAVNGSQLFATNQQVTANTSDIASLGTTVNNIAGNVSTAYTDANGDGIRYVRTNDRTLAVTDSFAQGIGSSALGYQATAAADNSLALGRDSQATILGGIALGSGSIANRALAPLTGQIPAGPTNIIEYNTTDKTLLGALSVGTATSYRQITNVADGTDANDAVTIRQLQGAIASVATTPSMYFHANSTGLDSLAVGAESVAVGPRTVVNGDNGIGIGNGAIVDQIAPGGTAIGQNAHVMLADGVALGTNATAGGIQSMALGAGATANHVNSVALGAGSATQAAVGTASTTILGTTYNFAGAAPVGTVSIGDLGAERTLTNLAAGRLSATSTDAVNGSQLYASNLAIASLAGGIGAISNSAVFYDLNVDGSKKNSLTLQGGDPNAPVVISNVAEGVAGTDAVNVNQLNRGVAEANAYTDSQIANIVDNGRAYTDQKFGELNQQFRATRREARQAAAVGLAAASLRFDDRPGKISVAAGGGVWRGEGALAFGAGYTSENGRVRANLTGATSGGEWGAGAGVSITLN